MSNTPDGRTVPLDVLRGVAILLVLGRHHVVDPKSAGAFYVPAAGWDRYGWTGVDLFFVLSGFLIGGLLLKEILRYGSLSLSRFWVRRGLKIWPSYYIFIVWIAAKSMATSHVSLSAVGALYWPSLLNVQNYFELPRLHLWSLAVEEHFYLLLPIALVCFASTPEFLRGARVLTAAGSILVACLAMRTWVVFNSPPSLDHHYWTHLRIDSLTFGFVLAYVFHCRPEWWERLGRHRRLLLTLGALAIAPAGILRDDNPWSVSFGLSALYMGYGAILVACLSTAADLTWLDKTLHGPWTRWLAFIGLYSYPIYLWHVDMGPLVVMALARVGGRLNPSEAWFAATVVFAALSVGIGVVMSTLIERPFLSLRDRNYPPRAALVRMDIPESGPAASSMSAD